jgi:hypothetical protein
VPLLAHREGNSKAAYVSAARAPQLGPLARVLVAVDLTAPLLKLRDQRVGITAQLFFFCEQHNISHAVQLARTRSFVQDGGH